MQEVQHVKGTDQTTVRTNTTIITGECQYCRGEFTFNPNVGHRSGNYIVEKGRVYAECPYCLHRNATDIYR